MTNAFWFKPKRIGYGATPSTWEGWVVTAAYCVMVWVCAAVMVTRGNSAAILVALLAVIIAATVALIVLSKKKTDGPWGWNAGTRQISGKNDRWLCSK